MSRILLCGRFRLDLSRPKIMAIINVTSDSFSGDGCPSLDAALRSAERAVEEGAELLDIGGESSRPGAIPVSEQQELDRVVPLVEALSGFGVPLSVDTVKPAVMRESLRAGADLINDIASFRAPGALEVVGASSAALCVMHMKGEPGTMQRAPQYG
ncbi:dihydropteroate synthase, partial [Dokdonella sp.]|uniref:dihydropteroate synthase n=1 Tax=Dokdonella sp. TaxID=2291710 RepID=UPI002DD6531E